jgi:hypothetical protein
MAVPLAHRLVASQIFSGINNSTVPPGPSAGGIRVIIAVSSKKAAPLARTALTESEKRKRAKDDEVRQTEQTLSLRAYAARKYRGTILSRSKVSNPGSRADVLLEREILQQLTKKLKKGGAFTLSSAPPRPVVKRGTTSKGLKKRISKRQRGFVKDIAWDAKRYISATTDLAGDPVAWAVHLSNWDHVSDVIKCAAYGAAMVPATRHAFSLRLSDDVIHRALRSKKGFVGYMQAQIAESLKARLPYHPSVPFVIALEGAYFQDAVVSEPFHIHGAIEVPPYPSEVIPGDGPPDLIRAALKSAGGKRATSARQLDIRPMYAPIGWFTYIAKYRLSALNALAAARKELGIPARGTAESAVGATQSVRRAGKAWFKTARSSGEVFWVVSPRKRRRGKVKR